MKLYRVIAEFEYFVTAEDSHAADLVARDQLKAALRDMDDPDVILTSQVSELRTVAKEWRESLPYGNSNGMTCEQILAAKP